MGGVVACVKKVVKTVTRVVKKTFSAVRNVVRKIGNTVKKFYNNYIKPVIRPIHNFVKKCVTGVKKVVKKVVSTVKRVVTKVKNVVKRVVTKVKKVVKRVYNKYIRPWAKPIIDRVIKFIPVVKAVSAGWNLLKKGYKFCKNTYKLCRNYIQNRDYKKYWNKIKKEGKKILSNTIDMLKGSSFVGNIIDIGTNIYKTYKKINRAYTTTKNLVKNGYKYIENYTKGIPNKYVNKKLKKYWNSNYNVFSHIPFVKKNYGDIPNSLINFYNKGKKYYDKGIQLYTEAKQKLNDIHNNILSHKSKILNYYSNINQIKNEGLKYYTSYEKYLQQYKIFKKIVEENSKYTFEMKVEKVRQVPTINPVNYCTICNQVCCQVCGWSNNSPFSQCTYFNGGKGCPLCRRHCPREAHIKSSYKLENFTDTKVYILEEKKRVYEENKILLSKTETELNNLRKKITDLSGNFQNNFNALKNSMSNLENISIKPNKIYSSKEFNVLMNNNEFLYNNNLLEIKQKVDISNLNNDFNKIFLNKHLNEIF